MLKKIPHTYVLIFYIIIFSAILTWIIPGGNYQRETKVINGEPREVIINNTYTQADSEAQSWQIFTALFKGFTDKGGIIVFIFMVGGAFMIVTESRAIDQGIYSFLRKTEKLKRLKLFKNININNLILVIIMLIFSLFGAIFGMSEETIPFVMILVPLAISMGYDSITGVSMVFLAAGFGFAGAFLNPFTVGIAQGIAEITPLFSGIEYRFFAWVIINVLGITYVLRYANKVYKSPEKSFVYEEDEYWRKSGRNKTETLPELSQKPAWIAYAISLASLIAFSIAYPESVMQLGSSKIRFAFIPVLTGLYAVINIFIIRKSARYFVITMLGFSILFLVVGVMSYGWYVEKIAAMFFALGIMSGIAVGYSPNKIATTFIKGVKDIAGAALVVGLAGGIIEILNDGKIIDTILYSISGSIADFGKIASISIMYFFQTLLNLFIPSGSGQAALTMPIMAPLSDLLGISRQAAVTAFQFGDGFTNMITPTSGVLIGVLGVAKVPYEKWFKFIFPLILMVAILACLLLIPTVTMELNGY
ncbi:MAG: AbgT family transporter [Bacteroidota bacterium]|nr:AbgT family transporter [Bacteroidota bacterium]